VCRRVRKKGEENHPAGKGGAFIHSQGVSALQEERKDDVLAHGAEIR